MAEESIDPLIIVTEENESVINKMGGKTLVENPSSPESARGKKPDSLKTVPIYLRASTGSCHDLCKFGRKHASDEITRKPLRLRTAKSAEIVVVDKPKACADNIKKHSLVVNVVKLSRTKTRSPNSPTEKSGSSNPPEIIKREILPSSSGNKMSRTDKMAYDHPAKRSSVTAKPVNKVRTSLVSDNTDHVHGNRRRYSDVQTSKKMTSSSMTAKKALMPVTASSSSPKFVRGKIIISGKTRKTGTALKSMSPSKNGSGTHSVGEDCEKILHVVENNAVEESPSLPNYSSNPDFDSSLSREKEKDDEQITYSGNGFEEVFVSDKNIVQPPTESHDYIGNEFAADEIDVSISSKENREETLEMGTENNVVEYSESSYRSDSPSLSSCEDEVEEEEEEDEEDEEEIKNSDEESKIETTKQNPNKTLRKNKLDLSEDKNRSPIKLKFRSGRTVDLQPENNTPRRLKFRRAKVNTNNKPDEFVSDKNKSIGRNNNGTQDAKVNQNKTSIRKNKVVVVSEDRYRPPRSPVKLFKSQRKVDQQSDITNTPTRLRFSKARASQRADESKPENSRRTLRKSGGRDDTGFSVISSRKLVLKHQDLEGKKDDQGLLNNVIEETASKLVETRKSKVKALVGAFETVISLQERKPSRRS